MVKHKIYSGMWICVGNYFVEKLLDFSFRFFVGGLNFYFFIGLTLLIGTV